jgi:hypothetical protein
MSRREADLGRVARGLVLRRATRWSPHALGRCRWGLRPPSSKQPGKPGGYGQALTGAQRISNPLGGRETVG